MSFEELIPVITVLYPTCEELPTQSGDGRGVRRHSPRDLVGYNLCPHTAPAGCREHGKAA